MSVPAAYLALILIWSTTPLAVKWSGEGPGALIAVTARLSLAALVCAVLLVAARVRLPWHRQARRAYLAAGVGLFGAMLGIYWAAQYVPSGLIAVIFGLAPLVNAALARLWLDERAFSRLEWAGVAFALAGLGVIFESGLRAGPHVGAAVAALLGAVFVQVGAAIGVKRHARELPAFAVTTAGLVIAALLNLGLCLATGATWPAAFPPRAAAAILYLALFGSVLGFALYFYALKHLPTARIALITLITPASALWLGHAVNGERVSARLVTGTALILAGLLAHYAPVLFRSRAAGDQARANSPAVSTDAAPDVEG